MNSHSFRIWFALCSLAFFRTFYNVEAGSAGRRSHLHPRGNGYDQSNSHKINAKSKDHNEQFETFISRPDIDCPRWDFTVYDEDALAPGYWFTSPYQEAVQDDGRGGNWVGPHIYDQTGELVWSGVPLFNGWDVFSFTKSVINGRDMLSLIFKHEYSVLLDNGYRIDKKIEIQSEGWEPNMHELHAVDNGTRLLQMKSWAKDTTREISAEIGYDGNCNVKFYGFEERDAETLETTFDWSSEGVIPLYDSFVNVRDNILFIG